MPSAIRRIHSKYLGEKTFPKDITEFEIREFFTLSSADLRAIRVDSNKKSRLALGLQVGFLRMTATTLDMSAPGCWAIQAADIPLPSRCRHSQRFFLFGR